MIFHAILIVDISWYLMEVFNRQMTWRGLHSGGVITEVSFADVTGFHQSRGIQSDMNQS